MRIEDYMKKAGINTEELCPRCAINPCDLKTDNWKITKCESFVDKNIEAVNPQVDNSKGLS